MNDGYDVIAVRHGYAPIATANVFGHDGLLPIISSIAYHQTVIHHCDPLTIRPFMVNHS